MAKQQLIGYLQPQDLLLSLMKERGLNYSRLAREIGASQFTVSQWVRGTLKPSEAKAIAVANFFGEPFESVWTYRLQGGQR